MEEFSLGSIFLGIATVSGLLFLLTVLAVPWFIVRIPADYFISPHYHEGKFRVKHPLLAPIVFVVRNILGFTLIAVGAILIFLPGPGIATIIMGFILIDLPKKRVLLLRFIRYEPVLRSINWMRFKANATPLEVN